MPSSTLLIRAPDGALSRASATGKPLSIPSAVRTPIREIWEDADLPNDEKLGLIEALFAHDSDVG
jgi:hypothetical protein